MSEAKMHDVVDVYDPWRGEVVCFRGLVLHEPRTTQVMVRLPDRTTISVSQRVRIEVVSRDLL